jgi:S1-C subfamily serine protease
MKNWTIATTVISVLAVLAAVLSYARLNSKITDAQAQVAALKTEVAKLQPSASQGGISLTMVDLISAIQPLVVRIEVLGSGFQASGSGVVIRSDGYLITNQHVIDSATSISVTLSTDQQFGATVVSSDSELDLAVLRLTNAPGNLPTVVLGSLSDIVVGGVAVAAGFPLGADLPGPASFTQGIVSAVRTLNGQRFVQSDVQINPGNSGGALVARTTGRLIGITTAGIEPRGQDIEGIGLAIPVDVVQSYLQAHPLN